MMSGANFHQSERFLTRKNENVTQMIIVVQHAN